MDCTNPYFIKEEVMTHSENGNCAIWRLTDAINRIDGAYYFCAKHMGVKENTLALLFALDDGKPHSQTQIAREWLIPKTTVNTIIREWRREGLVVLSPEELIRSGSCRGRPATYFRQEPCPRYGP